MAPGKIRATCFPAPAFSVCTPGLVHGSMRPGPGEQDLCWKARLGEEMEPSPFADSLVCPHFTEEK